VVYCEWDKVFLASHSGRAFDPSCSASMVISGVEDDGVHERFIATKPGWRMAVASDKDVYHSFIVRLFLRHELPDIDPFNGEPSEVENELAAILEKKLKGMSKEQIRQKAREVVDSLRQSVVPDELYELHKELRQNVKIKKDGTEQISAALAKVEALIAFLAPDEKDVSRAADWLARARSKRHPDGSVPLRNRLKQLVVPGPDGDDDVVITPLPALNILKTLADIYEFIGGKDAPFALRSRFGAYQRGYKNLQTTGVPGAKKFKVIVHRFTAPSSLQSIRDVLSLPEVTRAVKELRRKLLHRRAYLLEQGIDLNKPARSDIESDFAQAVDALGREIFFAVSDMEPDRAKRILDEALYPILEALRPNDRFVDRETDAIRAMLNAVREELQ